MGEELGLPPDRWQEALHAFEVVFLTEMNPHALQVSIFPTEVKAKRQFLGGKIDTNVLTNSFLLISKNVFGVFRNSCSASQGNCE